MVLAVSCGVRSYGDRTEIEIIHRQTRIIASERKVIPVVLHSRKAEATIDMGIENRSWGMFD